MKDFICIDFLTIDNTQLKKICDKLNLSYDFFLDKKERTYAKIWMDKNGDCIAFTLTEKNNFNIKDYNTVRVFSNFLKELEKMESYQIDDVVEGEEDSFDNPEIILDVDVILEKILKYGKESLTKEELKFLDNQ